jgi:hypothetical protein
VKTEKSTGPAVIWGLLALAGLIVGILSFLVGGVSEILLTKTMAAEMTLVQAVNFHGQNIAFLLFGAGLIVSCNRILQEYE